MNRKIVQIASLPACGSEVADGIIALADDGSLWIGYESTHRIQEADGHISYSTKFEWRSVAGIPQDTSNLTRTKS